jgi:hypothetical protein
MDRVQGRGIRIHPLFTQPGPALCLLGPALSPSVARAREDALCQVDHVGQLGPEKGAESLECPRRLRRAGGALSECHLGKRPYLQVDKRRALGQGNGSRRHAHLAVPVAEDDGAGFSMPSGTQVLVATPHIGKENTVRGHVGHN